MAYLNKTRVHYREGEYLTYLESSLTVTLWDFMRKVEDPKSEEWLQLKGR